jgi:hypothetical protein
MKSCWIAGVGALLAVTVAGGAAQTRSLKGHLVDVMCASHHASEAGYAEKHDKACLLMDECVRSGYSLVTADHKVLKLDARGNQLALDLIKKTNRQNDWTVTIDGQVTGDTLAVTSLRLQ